MTKLNYLKISLEINQQLQIITEINCNICTSVTLSKNSSRDIIINYRRRV